MSEADRYFAADASAQGTERGTFVDWAELDPLELVPGLRFQPVVGDGVMAPLHWHDEEQISFVVDGEVEIEVAGEKRLLRRGQAVVIPPNVPHAARTFESSCLEVDVFHPPRRGLLEAMERD